ncbi:hypothetical protein [uncultured Jannaschia sp.]|uniref:hypothetical protein n=1 Tax=uncultured Jannaschia sp. TaxID=293347 RepID=UPI00260AC902|nr:hypothetical protein [uncultured Jannaschia sp.]
MAKFDTPILPRPVEALPEYADARARRALAERLSDAFGLSAGAATCLANAVVDPSSVRKSIGEPDDPNAERITVPGGHLLGIRTPVWARKVMPDPRNPRTLPARKHPFATDPGAGREDSKFRPLPEPRTPKDVSPVTAELAVEIENRHHLDWACGMAKTYVQANNDWRSSIRAHGVMEAIWLVSTTYQHGDGADPVWAPTSAEGSSRTTAVHDILDVRSADVAYEDADPKFRSHIKRLNEALRAGTLASEHEAMMRCEAVPALVIVAFEPHGNSTTEFPTALKSLVALRHVDPPKPWGEGPENEALADEMLDEFVRRRLISPTEAAYYAGGLTKEEARAAHLSDDPVRRAAAIVGLVTRRDQEIRDAIRAAVTSQSTRKKIVRSLVNDLATALILRGMDDEPARIERARRYLKKGFGQAVHEIAWQPTGRDVDALLTAALAELRKAVEDGAEEAGGTSTIELAVRATVPLITKGALVGDQGTTNSRQPDRRAPAEVIDVMRQTPQGLHQLAQALRDYEAGVAIRMVDEDGRLAVDEENGDKPLNDTYLRCEFPPPGKSKAHRLGDSPADHFHNATQALAKAFEEVEKAFRALQEVEGDDGRPLVEVKGVPLRDCQAWRDLCREMDEEFVVWSRTFQRVNGVKAARSQPEEDDDDDDDDDASYVAE